MALSLWKRLLGLFLLAAAGSVQANVTDGRVLLKATELQEHPVELRGDWRFTFDGKSTRGWVPSSWTHSDFPKFGVGIYEVDIGFESEPGPLALWTEYAATQFKVFADGVQVHGPLNFETNPYEVRVSSPLYIMLPVKGLHVKLRIEVSNRVDIVAGLLRPVLIGKPEHIVQNNLQRKYTYAILTSLYAFLLLCFAFFGFRFVHRRRSFHLTMLCFSLLVSFGLTFYMSFGHTILWMDFIRLNDLGWIGFSYFFSICCVTTFDIRLPRLFTAYFLKIPVLAIFISLFFQIQWRSELLVLLYAYSILGIIINFAFAIQALRMKLKGSFVFVVTLILVFLALINDTLNSLGLLSTDYVIGYFFIVYLLVQAWLLAQQRQDRIRELERRHFEQLEQALAHQVSGVVGRQDITGDRHLLRAFCSREQSTQGFWVLTQDHGRYLLFFLAHIKGEQSGSKLTQIALSYSISGVLDVFANMESVSAAELVERCTRAAHRSVHKLASVLGQTVMMSLNCVDREEGVLYHVEAGELFLLRYHEGSWERLDMAQASLGTSDAQPYHVHRTPLDAGCRILIHNEERKSLQSDDVFLALTWNRAPAFADYG